MADDAGGRVRAALVQAATGKPREEIALEHGLLTGIAAFRWAAWGWGAILQVINIAQDGRAGQRLAGLAVMLVALAWTAVASVLVRRAPGMLLDRWALAVELAVAATMAFVDWWVYDALGHAQSLGTVWPHAVVLTAGVAYGGAGGVATGAFLGLVRAAGEATFRAAMVYDSELVLAWVGTTVLYGLTGGVAGFVTARLREAERRIAVARARDEVARTLHDGVLQTLAIVQRRSADTDLVALAREQEHELREFLFSTRPGTDRPVTGGEAADLGARLRAVSAEAERRYGLRSEVVIVEDPGLGDAVVAAVAGAVGEALTNAAKHGEAGHATIYAEPGDDGGLFCSVKDDGHGFDPATSPAGTGIARSIQGRLLEVGGTAEIDARPASGVEVRLHAPLRPKR
jgi:signal transduction histidine kinase